MNTGDENPGGPDTVVRVEGLTTRFGARVVHEDLEFGVRRGETLAIVGTSGCGKSTLLREMAALIRPTAGRIEVFGLDVTQLASSRMLALRRRIGILFQNGALFGGMTVIENVGVPLREHSRLSWRLIMEIACLKLSLVGLTPADGLLLPNQLSGGMRKRAALARAIALDPELLFLDEPTSGLDPLSADAFDDLVLHLKAALRPTIVLVTHDMDSLWRVADRVLLLGGARILGIGSMQELASSSDPEVARFFQSPRGRAARAQQ